MRGATERPVTHFTSVLDTVCRRSPDRATVSTEGLGPLRQCHKLPNEDISHFIFHRSQPYRCHPVSNHAIRELFHPPQSPQTLFRACLALKIAVCYKVRAK